MTEWKCEHLIDLAFFVLCFLMTKEEYKMAQASLPPLLVLQGLSLQVWGASFISDLTLLLFSSF